MNNELARNITLAITKERDSYDHYCHLVKSSRNANEEALFTQLALEEMKHEALLEEFLKTNDFEEAKENMASKYPPNFKIVDKIRPSVAKEGLEEGFKQALKLEVEDKIRYKSFMEMTDSPAAKDLFYYLTQEEAHHERLLRKEYEKFRVI